MRRSGLFGAQLLFTLLVCAFMFVPVVLSVVAGFSANYIRGFSSGLTLRWLFEVWGLYKDAIGLSLLIALACLFVTLLVGVPAAYFLAKANHWSTRLVEELLVTPLAVPGLAIALGLIITYGGVREFRSHWTFILVGHVLYTLARRDRRRLADGCDALGRRVQHHLDAAYANQQDGAGRPCRQLRLDADRDRQRLYDDLSPDDRAVAAPDPVHRGAGPAPPRRQRRGRAARRFIVMARSAGIPVRLQGCAKTFRDGTRALEPLDVLIEGGETLVLLGPSGCGKTTTLRIIAGLETPDPGGRVCVGDDDVTAVPI